MATLNDVRYYKQQHKGADEVIREKDDYLEAMLTILESYVPDPYQNPDNNIVLEELRQMVLQGLQIRVGLDG